MPLTLRQKRRLKAVVLYSLLPLVALAMIIDWPALVGLNAENGLNADNEAQTREPSSVLTKSGPFDTLSVATVRREPEWSLELPTTTDEAFAYGGAGAAHVKMELRRGNAKLRQELVSVLQAEAPTVLRSVDAIRFGSAFQPLVNAASHAGCDWLSALDAQPVLAIMAKQARKEMCAKPETPKVLPGAGSMVAKLRAVGLIGEADMLDPDEVASLTDTRFPRPPLKMRDVLAAYGRVVSFDAETGVFPNEHDVLLYDLAKLAPVLATVDFREDVECDACPYTLRAYEAGNEHSAEFANLGDWFDLPRTLGFLNTLLEKRGSPLRFLLLKSDDQIAHVLCATQTAVVKAIEQRLVSVDSGESARDSGQDFEDRVRDRLTKPHGQMLTP